MYTAKSSGLLHFGSCILDTKHLPRVVSKFAIELVANHDSCKDAIHLGVAQWLATVESFRQGKIYSLLCDSAMKVHALLPNWPVKVD